MSQHCLPFRRFLSRVFAVAPSSSASSQRCCHHRSDWTCSTSLVRPCFDVFAVAPSCLVWCGARTCVAGLVAGRAFITRLASPSLTCSMATRTDNGGCGHVAGQSNNGMMSGYSGQRMMSGYSGQRRRLDGNGGVVVLMAMEAVDT